MNHRCKLLPQDAGLVMFEQCLLCVNFVNSGGKRRPKHIHSDEIRRRAIATWRTISLLVALTAFEVLIIGM